MSEYDDMLAADAAGNEYDAMLQQDAADERSKLRQTLFAALDQNPDQYARAKQIEDATGLPASVGARNLERVDKSAKINEYDAMLADPVLRARFSEPDFASLAHDDVGPLQQLLAVFAEQGRALASGGPRLAQGAYGSIGAAFGAGAAATEPLVKEGWLPANPFAEGEQFFLDIARGQGQFAEQVAGPASGNDLVAQGIRSGLQSFGQQAPALTAGLLSKNPALALEIMTATTGGQSYVTGRDAGLDPLHALPYAATDAVIERITEGAPVADLIKNVGDGAGFLKTLGTQLAEEIPGEELATAWQDLNEFATLHPDKPLSEYLATRTDAATQTLIATLVGTGANVGLAKSVDGVAGTMQERQQKADKAQKDADWLKRLTAGAEASKLRERAPGTFGEFVQAAAEANGEAPTELYIDGKVLASTLDQSALPPEVAAQMPEALMVGGDVTIPVGVFASQMTEHAEKLLPHLRTSPEAASAAEAEVFMQQAKEQFQKEAQAALEAKQGDTEFQASADRVGEQLLAQLEGTRRFRSDVNQAYVKGLVQPFYATMAVRLGITPEEAFTRFPLQVQGAEIAGAQMDQGRGGGLTADALNALSDEQLGRLAEDAFDAAIGVSDDMRSNRDYSREDELGQLQEFLTSQRGKFSGDWRATVKAFVDQHVGKGKRRILKELSDLEPRLAESLGLPQGAVDQTATGNRGTFDPNDPNILNQGPQTVSAEQAQANFEAWADGSKIIGLGSKRAFKSGQPVTVAVLHGTTGDFSAFDRSTAGPESDLGAGFYASNNPDEVGTNYAGLGPDLTNKIEREAERLNSQDDIDMDEARRMARDLWMAHEGLTMPLWFKFNNPVVIGGKGETFLDVDSSYDEDTEEYGEPTGALIDVLDALRNVAENGDYFEADLDKLNADLGDYLYEGMKVSEFIEKAKASEGLAYVTDENGKLVSSELLRNAFEQAGFDGFIGTTVNVKFGSERRTGKKMAGMKPGTVHFVAFKPTQIKSRLGNSGAYDSNSPNILEQTATVRSGKETLRKYGLDPSKRYTTRQVAAALEARQRAKWGEIAANDRSPEALAKIAKWMTAEVEFEMRNPGQSGVGWYSEKFQRALDVMAEAYPELKTDRVARSTMTALIAITSDGQKVVPNFAQAMDIYGNFRATGKFTTTRGHARQASIDNNLAVLQRLYDQMGPEGMATYLMQERTISELKKIAKAHGGDLKSDYQAHIKMPMAAVEFGPKLGAFYANLMGAHGYLTMDRWWSRTFNRYRGTLLLQAPTKQGLQRFRELLGQPALSDDETIAATVPYRKSYEAKGFKDGSELEKAANTIYKASFENLEDSPFNASDRTFMLDAVNEAQKTLARKGYHLSVADIQAVLWYYEKRLYGELGARQSADISYEDAARRVVASIQGGGGGGLDAVLGNEGTAGGDQAGAEGLVSPGDEEFNGPLEQQARGQIAFGSDITQQPTVITLLQNADLSTYIHESGHFYLEVLNHIARSANAPPEIVADFDTALQWLKVEGDTPEARLAAWNGMTLEQKRPMHEQFARGFEAYAFEGKAPSSELNAFFQRFRAWMLQVYKNLKGLNVHLTDEVRGVFDRMLATDEQIELAQKTRTFQALFKNAKDAGMTEQEFVEYQALNAQATEKAKEELGRKSLRDMRWLSAAKSRVLRELQADAVEKRKAMRREVEAEVRQQPVYAAEAFLRRGELPEAARSNASRKLLDELAGKPEKLSLPALREMYGDGPAAPWRYLSTGKYGLASADPSAAHPDTVARLFGFTSGDHLVKELLAAEPFRTVVEALTDQRMLEKYGDISNLAEMEKAADAAVHNEARLRFVATELRALEKANAPGKARTVPNAAKEYAEIIVARLLIRDVKPARYREQEARAARGAEQALKKGNLTEATVEKRNQLVNGYALRAATKALGEVDSGVRYLTKFNRDAVREKVDPEYLDQIDQLLERFDLRRGVSNAQAEKRASLVKWLEAQRAQGLEPIIDPALEDTARRKPYKQMSVEEFRGLVDAVRNIEHLGRLKHKLLTAKDRREFAIIVEDAARQIEANASKTLPDKLERTGLDQAKAAVDSFFSSHRKLASLVRQMDGFKEGGLLWELWTRPMNAAGDFEASRREKATKQLMKILQPVLATGKMSQKVYIPEVNASLSREGRIAIALNMGNETNRLRVLEGETWTPAQLEAVLKTLTKDEWDFVQATWDFIDGFWPEIAAKEKRVTGVAPDKVEATPVVTPHGTYRGGYYPIKYDPNRSTKAEADNEAELIRQAMQGAYTRATTRRGHTKARTESVKRPVRKDLGVVFEHVEQVIHDLAWHEWLIDANRLLRAKPIDAAIRTHYGPEQLRQMRQAFDAIAAGDVPAQTAFERGTNWVRQGATVAGLGWNLTTSLLQPIGLTQSMVRIGPAWVAKGLARWVGDAAHMQNTVARIYEQSEFMRLRGRTMQREISEIRNRVKGRDSKIEASFFLLIQKMQLVADVPTWLGAYEKAMAQFNGDEAKAAALADQAVLDAQGGGQVKDLAGIQRGNAYLKLFTNFYSFFNTTYNLTAESFHRTRFKKPAEVGLFAVDMLLLYTVPAVLSQLLRDALKGEDEDDRLKRLLAAQASYLTGTMVGLREMSSALQGFAGYSGPAGARFYAELAKLGTQISQGDTDEAFWKALNSVAGVLFHYPSGQVQRTAEGVAALEDGSAENPGVLLTGPAK